MTGPLEGIRVVDLSHVLAAPFTTMILADLGAEVIKIEPFIGDDAREYGPFIKEADGKQVQSGYFISINRNKKSVCINLKTTVGKSILLDLVRISDIVIENFRPDTMKKLGLSYEELKKINQKIIYCSICGFGHDTLPGYTTKPSYDMVAQAYSGLMSITGPEGGPPCRVGTSIGDIMAGHQAAIGILSALWHRQESKKGQHVDISMVDGLVYILENAISRYTIQGIVPEPIGSAHPTITPFQGFETLDGWIVIAIGNDKLWADFCIAINREDLTNEARFKSNSLRNKNKAELIPILEDIIKRKTTKEWFAIFESNSVPYSPLNTVDKVINDPVINYRKAITEIEQPGIGKMKIVGTPFRLSDTPGTVRTHAPLLGEHTDEILTALLNYDLEQIKGLRDKNIIK